MTKQAISIYYSLGPVNFMIFSELGSVFCKKRYDRVAKN